jgi:uncharacterized glyoxalase superfamily protein PhnB
MQRSIDFYTKALGFTVRRADPDHASLERGADNLMFSPLGAFEKAWPLERKAMARSDAGRMTMFMESADLQGDFERAKAAGAEVIEEPVDRPWGQREFVVADPDGFWWTLWAMIPGE